MNTRECQILPIVIQYKHPASNIESITESQSTNYVLYIVFLFCTMPNFRFEVYEYEPMRPATTFSGMQLVPTQTTEFAIESHYMPLFIRTFLKKIYCMPQHFSRGDAAIRHVTSYITDVEQGQ